MNSVFHLLLLFTSTILSAQKRPAPDAFHDIDTIAIGDINNDLIIDTAYVYGPKWINTDDGYGDPKVTPYNINVYFSINVPPIFIEDAVGAQVENIGDIDEDGIAEIIIVPGWFIGCWGQLSFYSFKDRWNYLGSASRNVCSEYSFRRFIKRVNKKKIKVSEQIMKNGDAVEKSKIIKLH